ncbi:magnesium transporter CorA family protein [Polycyclovorans algicola]|uniref:magnesium transporter CorA family protein n=1 Tax=Polycyclovorans algicola TaxID=616992 RepID=UPI0004A7334D|nr:magnesium transporter CorA family protein [Polycyclovorans algicola]
MQILHFAPNAAPVPMTDLPLPVTDGYAWVDLDRDRAQGWVERLQVAVDPQHLSDSLNAVHPSFFDGTPDYDMLILAGLGPGDVALPLCTRTAAFFIFERLLVTVRAGDAPSFILTHARLADGRLPAPASPLDLAHQILDAMVDRFLAVRDPLDLHVNQMQDDLLDPDNGINDWRKLLEGRREVRRLEALCTNQLEAVDAFRRGTRAPWSPEQSVGFRDLTEHIGRVLAHASNLERDLEAAVQLHFAVATERTNRVVQTLTVISAIFFPLTLITGIYGMNFDHMPELGWRLGYFGLLGLLAAIGLGLLLLFKRRGYF